jgi:beta-galactosidase
VLGTPSAAPPAWLTKAYPDTLRVNENGMPEENGGRVQFSFTRPRYR